MTTTKAAAKGNQQKASEALGDGWDDVPRATSDGAEVAEWHPEMSEFKDEVVEMKMAGKPAGSITRPMLVGSLSVQQAFGEPRYFIDVAGDGKEGSKDLVRYALPLHGVLTTALDHYSLTPAPVVRLAFMGRSPRAKPGQQAAFLYDVRAKPASALLPSERTEPPALAPIHKANKEKRDAEERARKAAGGKAAADDSEE